MNFIKRVSVVVFGLLLFVVGCVSSTDESVLDVESEPMKQLGERIIPFGEYYFLQSETVLFKEKHWSDYKELAGADHDSFEVLDGRYAKDASVVYYELHTLKDADPQSFIVLPGSSSPYLFGKDHQSVYFRADKIRNADVPSFQALGGIFGKDKGAVYRWTGVIEGADPDTFEYIGDYYARDQNTLYYWEGEIDEVDLVSFEYLGRGYIRDKNGIYIYYVGPKYGGIWGGKIEGADPETFELLTRSEDHKTFTEGFDGFSRDQHAVYFFQNRLDGVDPESLKLFEKCYFLDNEAVYYTFSINEYVLEGADVGTFELVPTSGCYGKDKNHVYRTSKILEGIDPATFDPEVYKP